MKAISKYFAMCAIALLGLANTSCMSDDIDGTPSCDYDVVLEYKVGDSATETRAAVTRAGETTEDGSDYLNENKINRLDLFVFDAAGILVTSLPLTDASVQGSPTTDYKHKKLESDQLKRSDITGNTLYLVANLDNISGSIKTLDDLKAATINKATDFKHNAVQTSFVMDAKMEERPEIVNGMIHIKFNLKRALAKIRLNVQDDKGNTVDPTKYACQLIHYAADGSILAEGTCDDNKLAKAAAVATQNLKVDGKAVFYSYANNWLDKNKDPKAECNHKDDFYKAPVNKRLYEDNDEATTDGKPNGANFEPLYRLDRNTIYDVTAKVDREGGGTIENPAELKVEPTVMPWDDRATYNFNDAISIKTTIMKHDNNDNKIRFMNATYGPKISFDEMNTNGKSWVLQTDNPDYGFIYADKVKTDGSYDLAAVMNVITGTSTTTGVNPFYVVPKSKLDYSQRQNYTCHVYMIVYSPNMKVIIDAPSTGSGTAITGTPTDMEFEQDL